MSAEGSRQSSHSVCDGLHVRWTIRIADGDAVAELNEAARDGGDFFAGNQDTGEIKRIGSGNRYDFAAQRFRAECAQGLHRERQGKLLTQKIRNEASTADLASIFQAAHRDQHFPPLRKYGLAGQKLAEHDTITLQQHPADRFHLFAVLGVFFRIDERPPANAIPRTSVPPTPLASAAFGVDERTQIVEAIRRDESDGDKFPQCSLNLGFQPARAADDVGKKGGTATFEKLQYVSGYGSQARMISGREFARRISHPVRIIP